MQHDTIPGKVTFEEILFRSMGNISFLSTQIYSSSENEWQKNALNYEQAINHLERMTTLFLPETYWIKVLVIKRLANIYLKSEVEKRKTLTHTKSGYDLEVRTTVSVANAKYSMIMKALDQKGILFSRSSTLIDEENNDVIEEEEIVIPESEIAGLDDDYEEVVDPIPTGDQDDEDIEEEVG